MGAKRDAKTAECVEEEEVHVAAPDGGWGWVIVFVVFMMNFNIDGVIGCFGIFYPELLGSFKASPSLTSMAGSLIVGVYMISAPLVGTLIQKFGCQRVSLVGGAVAAAGLVGSSLAQNLPVFMLTYGLIGGIGVGMNSLCGHLIVNLYFHKRRGMAGGIVSAGAGFGVFVLAPVTNLLLETYGWRGAQLITAGIVLQFCVLATLMRPLNHVQSARSTSIVVSQDDVACHQHDDTDVCVNEALLKPKQFQILVNESSPPNRFVFSSHHDIHKSPAMGISSPDNTSLPDLSKATSKSNHRHHQHHHHHHHHQWNPQLLNPFIRKDAFYSGSLHHLKEFQKTDSIEGFVESMIIREESEPDKPPEGGRRSRLCDWSIFRYPVYIPMLIGGALIQMGQFIPSTFIPEYCSIVGLSQGDAATVIALYGAFNILGRLSSGLFANYGCINPLWLCNIGTFLCAVCCGLFPLCKNFPALCLFACGFGYFIGYFPPLQVLALVHYLGVERLTSAMGFIQLAKGPAALLGPPLAGLIFETTNDYAISMEFAGLLFLLAALAQSLVPLIDKCKRASGKPGIAKEHVVLNKL